ncbi:MAG: sacsin N-terminal ATP-binding-like domain-containing protein, partial [Deferrisomatales bacterium]
MNLWEGLNSELAKHVRVEAKNTLGAYGAQPNLVAEHVGIEHSIRGGGYGHRQIYELVQNAADAILSGGGRGRVHVLLTPSALYCANEGAPIDRDGVTAILMSHVSRKRGSQIGHFGVGFKSVLAVTRGPQFFSRSVSFGFDPVTASARIRQRVPGAEATPLVRIGEPLDPTREAASDPTLAGLMAWATTVVRLPRDESASDWLTDDLRSFPSAFLLFSPHVESLVLEDQVVGARREIRVATADSVSVVSEADATSRWRVFHGAIATSDLPPAARADADPKVIDRESLPVIWAVPLAAKRTRGRFWAFFPTEQETTLTGILNAPWKTNSDRQNLLEGAFNEALLDQAVKLVADTLPALVDPEDPGVVLDLLPARDTVGWADRRLASATYARLARRRSIPGAAGTLVMPNAVRLRPEVGLSSAAQRWLREVGEGQGAKGLCHPSVETRDRRSRAKALGTVQIDSASDWVKLVAQPASEDATLRAVSLVGTVWDELPRSDRGEVLKTPFILTTQGTLAAPHTERLFLPGPEQTEEAAAVIVHRCLAESDAARAVLARIGVQAMSPLAELRALLARLSGAELSVWDRVWALVRRVPEEVALPLLMDREVLLVRTASGAWGEPSKVLLPGPVVPDDGSRDAGVAVDVRFHSVELGLLRRLGLTDSPKPGYPLPDFWEKTWFQGYRDEAIEAFYQSLSGDKARPQRASLQFLESETAGPLDVLPLLGDQGRVLFTEALLDVAIGEDRWVMRHRTRTDHYPQLPFEPPVRWMIRAHGRLNTSLGLRAAAQAVSPALDPWKPFLPVACCSARAALALSLPQSLGELDEAARKEALAQAETTEEHALAASFYKAAAEAGWGRPRKIRCWVGGAQELRNPKHVVVAVGEVEALTVRASGKPFLIAPDRGSAATLVERWGLQPADPIRVGYEPSDEEIQLLDRFPGLKPHLDGAGDSLWLQPCSEIWVEVRPPEGTIDRRRLEVSRWDHLVCHVDTLGSDELLDRVIKELDLRLSAAEISRVRSYLEREGRQRLLSKIRAHTSLPDKLLAAIGVQLLSQRLPEALVTTLAGAGADLMASRVAAAAIAFHGVEVLRRHAADLEAVGLDPPTRWRGSPRALDFVQELGFPPVYAGFEGGRRPPTEEVDGPVDLKPLHPFQETIAARIEAFLAGGSPGRGLVSLPTGAGKTRVVVEALTRGARAGAVDRCLLWIAQSDELCEQAVQTWIDVWRSVGPRRRLRISRLWGATNNRVASVEGPLHLVVATFQSLVRRTDTPGFDWLQDASCVVIDEAHGSTTSSYTQILNWLGLTPRETARPLIGLT